jgi:hypothetical protein
VLREQNQAYPGLTSAGTAANDPVWKWNGLKGRIIVARRWKNQPWVGDIYDRNGFIETLPYTMKKWATHDYVFQVSQSGEFSDSSGSSTTSGSSTSGSSGSNGGF